MSADHAREAARASTGKGKQAAAAVVPFEFCKVCSLNHNQGRKHRYFPSHIRALSRFLSRFQDKLSDVRFFLKNPSPLRPEHAARNGLWCVFCDVDVSEVGSSFVCNVIYHLASSEHLKNLKHFLWAHGGGLDRVDSCSVSEADLLKWEKKCEALKVATPILCDKDKGGPRSSKDIRNELSYVKGEANISYICSRYYRAPELILGATEYTTSIDIWSAGCVLEELLLGQPLFPGESAVDQLVEIIKVLGTPTREEIRCMNPNYTEFKFPQIKAHSWRHKVFHMRMPPEAIDLTSRFLQYSPSLRCTVHCKFSEANIVTNAYTDAPDI